MTKRWMTLIAFLAMAGAVHAQQPPTDTDLKTAYCITVEKLAIANLTSIGTGDPQPPPALVTNEMNAMNERIARMQRYLLPRMEYLDGNALLMASAQAKSDVSHMNNASTSQCTNACGMPQTMEQFMACTKACAPEIFPRLWSCNDTSFLPF